MDSRSLETVGLLLLGGGGSSVVMIDSDIPGMRGKAAALAETIEGGTPAKVVKRPM